MKRKSSSLKVYPLIFFPRIKLIIKFWNKYEFVCLCYPVVLVDLTISSEKKNLNLIFYFHLYRYMQKKLEPFQFDFFHLFMDSDSHLKGKIDRKTVSDGRFWIRIFDFHMIFVFSWITTMLTKISCIFLWWFDADHKVFFD